MEQLFAEYYFDLSQFSHADLFSTGEYVWKALDNVSNKLKSNSLWEIKTIVPRGTFFENREQIFIGEGTVIEEGAFIRGPCIIGKNCIIRHGAYIRGDVITGDRCVIGHSTEIKNSILLSGAQAAHFAYIGDSILGNQVNLGAGTKCANLKLDHQEIIVHLEGNKVPTGRKKFGAIIGDRTQIGCNAVTNPGTLLGPDVNCYPCISISGVIASGRTVKPNEKSIVI